MGFGADGVVALEVASNEVMGMDVRADGDGLGGEAYDLVELTDGLARGDGADREFVPGGDVGERSKLQIWKGFARSNGVERDCDVVGASEHEGLKDQTVFFSLRANADYWYDHTLLLIVAHG